MATQIQSEAKESTVTTAEPELLYCLLHEQMVHVEHGKCGKGHIVEVRTDEGVEIDFCCFEGGYAFVPPPADEFPLDWAAQPAELSDDERAQAEIGEMGIWGRFE